MPAPPDWAAVLDALQRGDRVALVKVTAVITGFLTRYGAYEVRDSWDDLCQEVLIALIENARRGKLREARAFVTYTGTITRHKLADWLQRRHRAGRLPTHADGDGGAAGDAPVVSQDPELLVDLARALAELPEKQRQVVELVYVQGHSYEEAARRLDMPLGTLKRLQTQGLKALRAAIGVPPRGGRSEPVPAADLSLQTIVSQPLRPGERP